jgi:hypothetical protein
MEGKPGPEKRLPETCTNLKIGTDIRDYLKERKEGDETYDQTLRRLLGV